jgi:glutaredoxin
MKLIKTLLILITFVLIPSGIYAQEGIDKPVIYVREGCSHCAAVESFLEKNDLLSTVEIVETYNNEENQTELDSMFDEFDIPLNERGVPFMVYNNSSELLGGDTPIISYLADLNGVEVVEVDTSLPTDTSNNGILIFGGFITLAVVGYGIYNIFSNDEN